MTTDSFLALTCTASLGLLFGFILAFAGYRFFLFLLPFWGFFFGFGLGAQTIQALFGNGFLGNVTSWVVGFFFGVAFAVLSYLFFAAAVAILAGSLGYSLGVGLMTAIGFDLGLIAWLVGIVVAIAFIVGVFALSLYKWAIIISTAVVGAEAIVGTFLFIFGKLPTADFIKNPVKAALNDSPGWLILGLVIAGLGIAAQYQSTRNWTLKQYSRLDEVYPSSSESADMVPGTMSPAMAGASASGGMAPTPPVDVRPMSELSDQPPADGSV